MQINSKAMIRQQMSARVMAVDVSLKATWNQVLSELFIMWQTWRPPDCVAVYHPLADEPDLQFFYLWCHEQSIPLALPRMEAGGLVFHRWEAHQQLKTSPRWNLQEPLAEAELCQPSLILVPGRAFDHQGNRLGRGKGLYDRALQEIRRTGHHPIVVGVAWEVQMLASPLPTEAHDIRMHWIVTQDGPARACRG
jgi:5-formyltetrahydrofolate cyclo-ligase